MFSTMPHPVPLVLLLLLLQIQLVAVSSHPPWAAATFSNHTAIIHVQCLPDQALALLRLKRSFTITDESVAAFQSWKAGTDCCRWEGIRCGATSGRVSSLDLGDCGLESDHLDHVLFELTSLRYLNLGGNNFCLSEIPSTGFEQLTRLTHLNLSTSNFSGLVPTYSIGRLTDLVSLDLSFRSYVLELFDNGIIAQGEMTYPWQLTLTNLTTLVANLTSLGELHLGWVDMSDEGEEWCNALAKYTPNLRVLSLPMCFLSSPICGSLAGLQSLSVVNMQFNHLVGPFPEFFSNLSSLRVLQLSYNHLEGHVPPVIFQHKKLVTIDVHNNLNISGNLPNFSTDSNLENLFVGHTNFSGTIPSSISNLKHLKKLGLDALGFAGELPSSIGKLRSLISLQISGMELVGLIPSWITNLTSLEVLEFSRSSLYGPIPSSIGDLKKLRKLALYRSNFSGKIPPVVLNLTQLDTLHLHSNNLIGTMQLNSLWKLQSLSDLNLSNNKLNVTEGEHNSSLVSFPDIWYLRLASCNVANFPNILRHSSSINGLDLSNNQIRGAIPQWAWEKWTDSGLFFVNLSHNEFTSVGYDSFLPFYIVSLDLSFNMLEGPIPIPQHSGEVLDYSSNRFSSIPLNISTQLNRTSYFKASNNHLSGNIPPSFCSTRLEILDLSYNNLNGSIPSCLLEDANALQVLYLKGNQLHGELPHNINESCMLEALDFSNNQIKGRLPRSLASCKYLEVLDIGNNQISDSFPCWMAALSRLQVLVLKSNKFFGQVTPAIADDKNICEFPSLRILDLASNNLSGTLTEEWFISLRSMMVKSVNETSIMKYNSYQHQVYQVYTVLTYKGSVITFSKILTTLVFIDLSNNAMHGSIPGAIGELVLLQTLNMSRNSFTGPIPSQFGCLNQLESLDLSSNGISGEIPQEISSLDFLTTLNLSNNMLEGRIPESRHFSTFDYSSFMGNTGLCGPPLSKQCNDETTPNSALHNSEEKSVDVMLFLFVGLGFGVGFAVAIVVIWVFPIRKNRE